MISQEALLALLPKAFSGSHLPLASRTAGKVRDGYPLSDRKRLLVTTDRLSAFDQVLACVPYKGQVLNQLSGWWFEKTKDIIANHLLELPDPNASLVTEAKPLKVEVVVRGYISGVTSTALWYRYSLGERDIYGYRFPEGLRKNQALLEAIITPTTKGGEGSHDERLTCAEVVSRGILTADLWDRVQVAAISLFKRGQELAMKAGLLLVDTKYEFGLDYEGHLLLIDEVHTPDSSRFWKADSYAGLFEKGDEPENFDKEFVRLAYAEKGYRGDGQVPVMPDTLWTAASQRYIGIQEMLTGQAFAAGPYPVEERLIKNLRNAGIIG